MKKALLLLLSLFTLVQTFGQSSIPNLIEKAHELSFHINQKHVQTLKTNDTEQFKLDSIISGFFDPIADTVVEQTGRTLLTYDQNGYPASIESYLPDPSGSVIPSERLEFSNNEDGNYELLLYQSWDAANSKWENEMEERYVYDGRGNLEARRTFSWIKQIERWGFEEEFIYTYSESGQRLSSTYSTIQFGTGKIILSDRVEYTYDENDYPDSTIFYNRDLEAMKWIPDFKYCQAFDQFGNQLLDAGADWDPEKQKWIDRYREENVLTYNEQDQITSITFSYKSYSDTILTYSSSSLTLFEYDEQGRLILETEHLWDSPNEEWDLYYKWEYTYGAANVPKLAIGSMISRTGNEVWIPESRVEIMLDENGNLIDITSSYWDNIQNEWEPDERFGFGRNKEILLSELNNGSLMWVKELDFVIEIARNTIVNFNTLSALSIYYWDADVKDWMLIPEQGEFRFYYSPIIASSVNTIPSTKFKVYPNPVAQQLYIETAFSSYPLELSLYDLSGKKQYRTMVSGHEALQLPSLPSGLYVIQLSKDKKMLGSQKLIIGSPSH